MPDTEGGGRLLSAHVRLSQWMHQKRAPATARRRVHYQGARADTEGVARKLSRRGRRSRNSRPALSPVSHSQSEPRSATLLKDSSGPPATIVAGTRLLRDDKDWVCRRLRSIHPGVPTVGLAADDFDGMEELKNHVEGSFGKIYKAQRKADGEVVILKIMEETEEVMKKDIVLEICLHEALAKGHCPKAVGYHGVYKSAPELFALVLEAFDMSLDVWLFRSGQPILRSVAAEDMVVWGRARATVTNDILQGLQFLHSVGDVGIIHRDIKVENILLRQYGERGNGPITKAVLTDFGLSCVAGSDFEVLGTARYNAPEMLMELQYGLPVDVWAMGVTLLQLWTVEVPLRALTDLVDDEKIEERVLQEFAPPANLGPCWEEHSTLLLPLPEMRGLLRQCFLAQNLRVTSVDLCQQFKELMATRNSPYQTSCI